MSTVQEALLLAAAELKIEGSLDAQLLLAHVLGKSRTWLYTWPEKILSVEQELQFFELITLRVTGHPIAYLLGNREFWNFELEINTNSEKKTVFKRFNDFKKLSNNTLYNNIKLPTSSWLFKPTNINDVTHRAVELNKYISQITTHDSLLQDSVFFNFINDTYDKLSYFDLYGNSVIIFILMTLFVFLVYTYCKIMQTRESIADDWVNQRCKPEIMPFAVIFF